MSTILVVLQFILALVIVLFVLLQKSANMGFGSYSGSNESLFGAKGPTSFLAKSTMFLGALFVINTLALGYLYNAKKSESVIDSIKQESIPSAPNIPQIPTTNQTTNPISQETKK